VPDHLHKSARALNFKSTRNFCSNHYGCCYRNKQYAPNRLSLKMRMSAFFPQVPTAGLTFPPIKQSKQSLRSPTMERCCRPTDAGPTDTPVCVGTELGISGRPSRQITALLFLLV
jgi:hypothetical protein